MQTKSVNNGMLIIGYACSLLIPLIAIIMGISFHIGNYDKRTQNHGTYLILISAFVGYGLFRAIT